MTLIPAAYITGAITGASLIAAIGAQNAFVLTQGVKRNYFWQIALTCALIDTLLIFAGAAGMGALINRSELFLTLVTWGGATFLVLYGCKAGLSALKSNTLQANKSAGFSSLSAALMSTAALSLLNPHVYLDTVVLLGSIAGRYDSLDTYWFAAGASSFSLLWFLTISYGARALTPLFANPLAWRVLDCLVALTMWTIAYLLLTDSLGK